MHMKLNQLKNLKKLEKRKNDQAFRPQPQLWFYLQFF